MKRKEAQSRIGRKKKQAKDKKKVVKKKGKKMHTGNRETKRKLDCRTHSA